MATINYKIYEGTKETTKVYIRFRGKGFDAEIATELVIFRKDWSTTKQKVKATANSDDTKNVVNISLKELKDFVFEKYNTDYKEGKTIDNVWLKTQVLSFNNQSTTSEKDITIFLTDYADKFAIESKERTNKKTGKPLSSRTILDFQDTCNKLRAFEKHIGKKVKFLEVDLKFHKDFISFLRTIQRLGDNTIGAKIDNIKAFLRDADINQIKINPEYKSSNFFSPSFKPKDIYFDEDEISRIIEHSFEIDGYLDNARDWLIIGLWTGLRVSDLLPLTKKDVKNGYIDNTNFKTNIPVTIPLHPHVKNILDKRHGEFPRKISDQNFNNYIKKVAEEVGFDEMVNGSKTVVVMDEGNKPILDEKGNKMHRKKEGRYKKHELVSSHICRRSFATNLYGKIDTLTIMKITGHATEKQFLGYIKITPKHHAEKLSKLWAEMYKNK
jgi:integrase